MFYKSLIEEILSCVEKIVKWVAADGEESCINIIYQQ